MVTIEHDRRLDIALAARHEAFNGTFVETLDATLTSDGSDITMTLERLGGGNLTMQFSDGLTVFDSSALGSIVLTEGGGVPSESFVYILKSDKVLTEDTSGWPSAEHIKVASYVLNSAGYVQTNGPIGQYEFNDHAKGSNGMGHLTHIAARLRANHAIYQSGLDQTISITTNGGALDNVDLALTSGSGNNLPTHTIGAYDTGAGDDVHVVNDSATKYKIIADINEVTLDSTGAPLNNKYFNLVFWTVLNKAGTEHHVFLNLPSGSYNNQADAETDVDRHDTATVPAAFGLNAPLALMLYRFTFRLTSASGGTWTHISTRDLRGQVPSVVIGGGVIPAQTTFADSVFEVYNAADDTKRMRIDVSAVAAATVRILAMPDADVDLRKNNLAASAAPTADDDSDDKYAVGSVWIDTTADKAYVCLDATVAGAVWIRVLPSVADDATPQLGGNLDVNGKSIVSIDNGDIEIAPNGSGNILLNPNTGAIALGGFLSAPSGTGALFLSGSQFTFAAGALIRLGTGVSILHSTGNVDLLSFASVGGTAINKITIGNAATGNDVTIAATGDDDHINLALSGKGNRVVLVDGIPVAAAKYRRYVFHWYIETPVTGDDGYVSFVAPDDCVAYKAYYSVQAATNVVFNINIGDDPFDGSPTALWASDKTATTSSWSSPVTSFTNPDIDAGQVVTIDTTSISGTPGIWVVSLIVNIKT